MRIHLIVALLPAASTSAAAQHAPHAGDPPEYVTDHVRPGTAGTLPDSPGESGP